MDVTAWWLHYPDDWIHKQVSPSCQSEFYRPRNMALEGSMKLLSHRVNKLARESPALKTLSTAWVLLLTTVPKKLKQRSANFSVFKYVQNHFLKSVDQWRNRVKKQNPLWVKGHSASFRDLHKTSNIFEMWIKRNCKMPEFPLSDVSALAITKNHNDGCSLVCSFLLQPLRIIISNRKSSNVTFCLLILYYRYKL